MNFRELANESISSLTPYQPGKPIEELERELGITSSIKLASNENPLGPSPKAMKAAEQALKKGHIYPDSACFELKSKLAVKLTVNPDQLTIGNGSENIIEIIMKAYLRMGDSAVISQYAFLTIPIQLKAHGVKTIVVPSSNWGHDVKAMVNAIDNKTRVLFLVNPNNPTGTFTNRSDFEWMMKNIPSNILVVVDEAYAEYIQHPDYPNALDYLEQYSNLLTIRTFSKIYGMASLRLGYAVSSPDITDILNRARMPFNVNGIAIKAGCAALDDDDYIMESIQVNSQGLVQLENGFKNLGLSYIPSLANFITVNVGNGNKIYQSLLHKGVIIRPLTAYGMPEHIRVSVGTQEENQRFLSAIEEVLENIDPRDHVS